MKNLIKASFILSWSSVGGFILFLIFNQIYNAAPLDSGLEAFADVMGFVFSIAFTLTLIALIVLVNIIYFINKNSQNDTRIIE